MITVADQGRERYWKIFERERERKRKVWMRKPAQAKTSKNPNPLDISANMFIF